MKEYLPVLIGGLRPVCCRRPGPLGDRKSTALGLRRPIREYACRTRKDHSAEDLAVIRRMAFNGLRHNGPMRDSFRRRKLRATFNDDYRLRLLFGQTSPAIT